VFAGLQPSGRRRNILPDMGGLVHVPEVTDFTVN